MFDLVPDAKQWRRAVQDLVHGCSDVRLFWLLGQTDMRQRYSRSRLGPFWITLSMAAFVGGIGVVNASLFRHDVSAYLPYLTTRYLAWTLIAGVIGEAASAFVQAAGFLRQMALPKTTFVLRVLVRQVIAYAHHLILLPVVFVLLGAVPGQSLLIWPFGLALSLLALFGMATGIAVLATRFRDLPQLVQSVLQMAFFVTPVVWKPDQIGEPLQVILNVNPLAVLLELMADPLLGMIPPLRVWISGVIVTALSLSVGLTLLARFRARIVYWL